MTDRQMTKQEMSLLASNQFSALRAAGWTPGALRAAGWTPGAIRAAGLTPSDLRAAGWTPGDLRAADWTPSDLRAAGLTPSALVAVGWTASDLIAAGWTPSALRAAGWTPSDLERAFGQIPLVETPYTTLLADIRENRRKFRQSTFGPELQTAAVNICNTAMCTAGHLVSMAGNDGWKLREKFGWANAASLIHDRAHPGWPCQNFGAIPDEWAMAYIEEMAAHEANGTSPAAVVAGPAPAPNT